jgi:uncharacterized iron-regulated membrane protein
MSSASTSGFSLAAFWRAGLRWLAFFHRWTGIALCLLFAVWFVTGAVMLFVPFPSLPVGERVRFAEPVDMANVSVTPAAALAAAGGGGSLRLVQIAGKPAYVVGQSGAPFVVIDAITGAARQQLKPVEAEAVAGRFPGMTSPATASPVEYDQWIVHQQFDAGRPYYRVALGDKAGTELYISARTGEAIQRTQSAERSWNWLGSVIHWIYVTPLRRSFTAWDQTVWWVSLIGLSTALAGAYLGVYRSWRSLSQRKRVSPYRGWLRWHHILGLGGGLFVTTWIFSGWLSMDHGRLFSRGEASDAVGERFTGLKLADAAAAITLDDLRKLGPASRIDFGAVAGQPVAAAVGAGDPHILLKGASGALYDRRLPDDVLLRAATAGWPDAAPSRVDPVPANDFYDAAEGFPAGSVKLSMGGPKPFDLYVDAVHGSIATVMDPSRRAYAWVYFALHSFKLPGLIERPILWRCIMLIPLTLGFAFSVTGVIVGISRLRLDFGPKRKA